VNQWTGGLIFAGMVLGTLKVGWWLAGAIWRYTPCIVYRIPLVDGRVYIGHAKDGDRRLARHYYTQRGLVEGHPRKWWPLVPEPARSTRLMPAGWVVSRHRSEPLAQGEETRLIRQAQAEGQPLANRILYKGVGVTVDD
jgi:hypothetical protein